MKFYYFRFDKSKGHSVVDGTKMVADDKIPKSTQVWQPHFDLKLSDYRLFFANFMSSPLKQSKISHFFSFYANSLAYPSNSSIKTVRVSTTYRQLFGNALIHCQ